MWTFAPALLAAFAAALPAGQPAANSAGWHRRAATLVGNYLPALGVTEQVDSEKELQRLARRALELLNEARAAEGLRQLASDPTLQLLALHHSREMAARGMVTHHSKVYGLTTERRVRISYPYVPRLGENVARNRTLQRLHEALLASSGHRKNRLNPFFTHVGIGLARANRYLLYFTEVFVEVPEGDDLDVPVALYFEAAPDAYERREAPRAEVSQETFTVGAPGPNDPEYWTTRGIAAFERDDLRAAAENFERALDIDPDYHYASFDLARVRVRQGRSEEAIELLDAYLEDYPDDSDARFALGTAVLLLQEYAAAERAFRRVLEKRPNDANAWYNLGLSLEYQDRGPEAASAYAQALHLDPTLTAAQAGLRRVSD